VLLNIAYSVFLKQCAFSANKDLFYKMVHVLFVQILSIIVQFVRIVQFVLVVMIRSLNHLWTVAVANVKLVGS
jgi:hypothetical protein